MTHGEEHSCKYFISAALIATTENLTVLGIPDLSSPPPLFEGKRKGMDTIALTLGPTMNSVLF